MIHFKTPAGWETIKMMAKNSQDKYGRFFNANKNYFKSIAAPADFFKRKYNYCVMICMVISEKAIG